MTTTPELSVDGGFSNPLSKVALRRFLMRLMKTQSRHILPYLG